MNRTTHETRCFICHNSDRAQFWHTTDRSILDRAECRNTGSSNGQWLCTVCEESVHLWMKQNPDVPDAAAVALSVMIGRLKEAIFQPRKTRRRAETKGKEQ